MMQNLERIHLLGERLVTAGLRSLLTCRQEPCPSKRDTLQSWDRLLWQCQSLLLAFGHLEVGPMLP